MMKRHGEQKKSRADDVMRAYLESRGVSGAVIAAGLPEAVAQWETTAKSVDGYRFTLDDWLNDVDLRDIIAGALNIADESLRRSISVRLKKADNHFLEATVASGPVWGTQVASSRQHDPSRTWWYFRIPREPGETLLSDLRSAGLL